MVMVLFLPVTESSRGNLLCPAWQGEIGATNGVHDIQDPMSVSVLDFDSKFCLVSKS